MKDHKTSLVAQMVKRLPTMQETWAQSLGQEDPLKKEMTTHSSTLAWKIPWMEAHGRLQSMGSQRVGHDWRDLATAAAAWEFQLIGKDPDAGKDWRQKEKLAEDDMVG